MLINLCRFRFTNTQKCEYLPWSHALGLMSLRLMGGVETGFTLALANVCQIPDVQQRTLWNALELYCWSQDRHVWRDSAEKKNSSISCDLLKQERLEMHFLAAQVDEASDPRARQWLIRSWYFPSNASLCLFLVCFGGMDSVSIGIKWQYKNHAISHLIFVTHSCAIHAL